MYRFGDIFNVFVIPSEIERLAFFTVLEVDSTCLFFVRICTQVLPFIVLAQIL